MRQALTDGSGKWFEMESAIKFAEATWWNGSNHISVSTDSQWEHEALYYTRGGRWVRNSWSQYQGVAERYEEISESAAAAWLIQNDHHDELTELPAGVRAAIEAEIDSAEV